jgi:hypothetical protein
VSEHGTDTSEINVVYSDSAAALATTVDPRMRQIARQLGDWVNTTRGQSGALTGNASLFDRGKYISSDNPYDQMRTARAAVRDDDVVASALELTEGLAFQGVKWECGDWDTSDIFNQMAAEQNLDELVRKMHREEFTYSQSVLAFWWDEGEFTVRGETDKGNKRKRTVKVWYPRAVTILDAARVVPVGMMMFGQERLAWQATKGEIGAYYSTQKGELQDPLMDRFYSGHYTVPAGSDEMAELTALKVDTSRLLLLDDKYVRRHTSTKSDYERFPAVRLKSIFRLLDMKQQLLEADRVSLIGAANYILLVKKGDEKDPAYPEEIANLKENYHTLAKLPVIFSDHRLNIEIVAPKTDFTLQGDKYDVLDKRIIGRLLNVIGSQSQRSSGSSTSATLGRPVARSLENRRHMLRRFLEREIAKAVVDHPKNKDVFPETPSLAYTPPSIQLDADAGTAAILMQARTMRDLSRESFLEYFGFDQEVEAMRFELEADKYDDIFKTAVPFNSPANQPDGQGAPAAQGVNGAKGGRPAGGGTPKQSPGSAPKRNAQGNTSSTGGAK